MENSSLPVAVRGSKTSRALTPYYLNLEYRFRQIMANQIGPNDLNSPDWSTTKKPHEELHVLNANSFTERNAATFCSRKKLSSTSRFKR